jgi:hypothetical protein
MKIGCSLPTDGSKSPRITRIVWGAMEAEDVGQARDLKLLPGGGREWDWSETNTHHVPGILIADVRELLDEGSELIVLSRGMQLELQITPEVLQLLKELRIPVFVEETRSAVATYNRLVAQGRPAGGLFHSTC